MICPQCKTRNPIGNKFCRECGGKLEVEGALQSEEAARVEEERTRERVATLLAESFALMEQDKPDLALPLAEEAAQLLPDSTSAHALLATLYERTEQKEQAIAAMERVVALNPGSQADQEKLEQIQRGVRMASQHSPARRREKVPVWMPVALAGATCVLVLSIGLTLLKRTTATRQSASYQVAVSEGQGAPLSSPLPPADSAAADAARTAAAPAAPSAAAGRDDPFVSTTPGGSPTARASSRPARAPLAAGVPMLPRPRAGSPAARPPPGRFRTPGGALPAPRAGRAARSVRPAPVTPGISNSLTSAGVGGAERIVVRPPSPGATAAPSPPNPSGYIRIQVGAPPRTASAPATPVEQDPMLRAQSLQSTGRYADAVTAYQQALRTATGTARGDAYQGIALSQQRLGNRDAARNAYRQAIAFYESSGGAASQQGIAACRAALEVLGDG